MGIVRGDRVATVVVRSNLIGPTHNLCGRSREGKAGDVRENLASYNSRRSNLNTARCADEISGQVRNSSGEGNGISRAGGGRYGERSGVGRSRERGDRGAIELNLHRSDSDVVGGRYGSCSALTRCKLCW